MIFVLFKRLSAFLFLGLFLAITLYLTTVIIKAPSVGLYVERDISEGYIVHSIGPEGQAKFQGMQVGDLILEVNGEPAGEFNNLIKYNSLDNADHVLVYRGSTNETLAFTFAKAWSSEQSVVELLLQLYIPGASLFIFCAFSLFLYVKRKDDPAAIMLILFIISVGICYYSSSASNLRDPVGLSIIYVVLPLVPLFYMSFMNMYLRRFDSHFISNRLLGCLFGAVGVVSLFSLMYIWQDILGREVYTYIKGAHSGILLLGNLTCVFKLIDKFVKHRKTKLKSLFTITLITHIIAFTPFAMLNLLPQMLGETQVLPSAFTALFLFVLPIVYFYLSTSNQLFDIDFILTRFKYYTALSLIPSLVIALLLSLFIWTANQSWSGWLIIFLIVYIGITLFLYGKEQIDNRFRPKLFKAMYSYQDSLDRFSRNIAKVMKQSDLENVLKEEISHLLPVNRITFLIVDQEEQAVFPMSDNHEEKVTGDFMLGIVNSLKLGELIDLPFGLGMIIGRQRSRYHLLWIGMKTNHTRFNSDEIRWLKTIANYSSIVFENLYLIEGLIEDLESEVRKEHSTSPWVLRLLFCLSENERRKLAADLHDSALQDQLLWYRKLESVMMDHPMSAKLGSELEDIKEGLLDVIHQIRETCNELRPPLLKEMGAVEAVDSIIEHTQMRVNFEVQFHPKPLEDQLDEEQITAIYRIVQELLRNADKHAGARLVTLELEQRQDTIYFRYQDDGIGMDVNHMTESFRHMGLSGIKERVASLEGDISFHSKRGNGLEVLILMPVMTAGGRSERGVTRDSYLIS
ncbi:ATP-binding protein [Paenibacillus chungangensis]|uniref:histidine kinase n=1 Tax=Paenibacillus chungangensis TaxID=696535 RepID=A0ABW3HTL6_9BACL